ncbi:DUF5819 family protein [Streptomyces sp. NPDC092369]|uniref:DUF5819 family protein n=1 Tax=Streptomyces sp. NPDC092369 TaxID=3366015 RepID=UPI0037FAFDD9
MDAYDTDSDARPEPDGPGGPDEAGTPAADAPPAVAPAEPTAPVPTSAAPPAFLPPAPDPRTGVAALSPRYQVAAALALAVVAVTVCVHLVLVFLHVAPSNTVTKQHGNAIDDWVYPEFEQNWKLFAPNPLQQNIAVQVRAEVHTDDGEVNTTGWYDLSAEDGRAIDGNLLPSHTDQNELRRAWDFFASTHDGENRSTGLRGALSETYLRRIVVLRLDREDAAGRDGVIKNVQVRARTTNVSAPKWSDEKISDTPMYRVLPWWTVTAADSAGGAA